MMALQFRKRVKLLAGLRLNLSRRGVSASVGKPGATVNLNRSRLTLAEPGTGLSYAMRVSGWLLVAAAVVAFLLV